MGASTRQPLPVVDGHYCVPDPAEPSKLTYWTVVDGKVRDYPDDVRWRPLPPTPPPDVDGRAERRAWTNQWYETTYFPWRDAVDAAILDDPPGARDRFTAAYPHAELPPQSARRRRTRTPQPPKPRRPRKLSAAEQRLAAERLAARALSQLGYGYRRIGEELGLPLTTVHRRMHSGRAAEVSTVALLAKAAEVETALLAGRIMQPGEVERIDRWLAELRQMAEALRPASVSGESA